jgi:ribosome-associated heat shock protein Hsp15
LWCARFMRARTDCAALAAQGRLRINRQPTDKPHARLRIGDVLTVPLRGGVRVVRVVALAARRGPASEARLLYEDLTEPAPPSCAGPETTAYPSA